MYATWKGYKIVTNMGSMKEVLRYEVRSAELGHWLSASPEPQDKKNGKTVLYTGGLGWANLGGVGAR